MTILEDCGEELDSRTTGRCGTIHDPYRPPLGGRLHGACARLEELLADCGISNSDLEVDYIDGSDDSPAMRVGFPASPSGHKDPQNVRDRQNERNYVVSRGA